MGWLDDLLSKLSGQEPGPPPTDHPMFGRIYPSFRPKTDAWHWEMLDDVPHPRGIVSATWRSGPEGPSEEQVQFWLWLRDHIDDVVEQSRNLLAEEVERWTRKPAPADLWDELVWVAADLPIDGRHDNDW